MTYKIGTGFAEKEIEELKTENNKLLDVINNQDVKIADLEKKIAELERVFRICEKNADTYYDQLTKAKELLKEAQGYIENEDDELYDKIEQFLKELDK